MEKLCPKKTLYIEILFIHNEVCAVWPFNRYICRDTSIGSSIKICLMALTSHLRQEFLKILQAVSVSESFTLLEWALISRQLLGRPVRRASSKCLFASIDCAYQVCLKRLVSAQIHSSRFVSFWNWVELHFLFAFQYLKNKVSLQTSLERNSLNFSYIIFLGVNFENLTVKFHILYVINMHIKFHLNQILFTIWLINLFFIYNFRLQKLEIITFIWWHSNWSLIFLKFCKQ